MSHTWVASKGHGHCWIGPACGSWAVHAPASPACASSNAHFPRGQGPLLCTGVPVPTYFPRPAEERKLAAYYPRNWRLVAFSCCCKLSGVLDSFPCCWGASKEGPRADPTLSPCVSGDASVCSGDSRVRLTWPSSQQSLCLRAVLLSPLHGQAHSSLMKIHRGWVVFVIF